MDRTPYLGDVAVVVHPGKKEMGTPLADTPTRPVTRHGGMRDLHESSFSLSGTSLGPRSAAEMCGQGSPEQAPRLLLRARDGPPPVQTQILGFMAGVPTCAALLPDLTFHQ